VSDSPVAVFLADVPPEFHRLGVVRRHQKGAYLILEGDRSDHVLMLRSAPPPTAGRRSSPCAALASWSGN
jgi:hypothetical protein